MELIELGFSRWLEEQAKNLCGPDQRVARFTVVGRANKEVSNAYILGR